MIKKSEEKISELFQNKNFIYDLLDEEIKLLFNKDTYENIFTNHKEHFIKINYNFEISSKKGWEKIKNKYERSFKNNKNKTEYFKNNSIKKLKNIFENDIKITSSLIVKLKELESQFNNRFLNFIIKELNLLNKENIMKVKNIELNTLEKDSISLNKNKEFLFPVWLKKNISIYNAIDEKNQEIINELCYKKKNNLSIFEIIKKLTLGNLIVFVERFINNPFNSIKDKNILMEKFITNNKFKKDRINKNKIVFFIQKIKFLNRLRNAIYHNKNFFNFFNEERKFFLKDEINKNKKIYIQKGKEIKLLENFEFSTNYCIEFVENDNVFCVEENIIRNIEFWLK